MNVAGPEAEKITRNDRGNSENRGPVRGRVEMPPSRLSNWNDAFAGTVRREQSLGHGAGQPRNKDADKNRGGKLPARLVPLPDSQKRQYVAGRKYGNTDHLQENDCERRPQPTIGAASRDGSELALYASNRKPIEPLGSSCDRDENDERSHNGEMPAPKPPVSFLCAA